MEVVTVIAVMESRKRTRRKRIKKEKDDKEEEEEEEEKIPIREGVPVCGEEAATLPPLALPQAARRP